MTHPEPVTQYEIEKRFYDYLQRPENRGFNAAFARWLNHADDSHVSRMHSPHVPETPSWLWKAAERLDKACRANLAVAEFALSTLAWVVGRYRQADRGVRFGDARRTFSDLEAAHANFEDGMLSAEELQAVKDRHLETVARVGLPTKLPDMQVS